MQELCRSRRTAKSARLDKSRRESFPVRWWNPVPVIHTELIIVSSRPAHILPPRRFKMAKIDHEQ
jgi:hypothetical protein